VIMVCVLTDCKYLMFSTDDGLLTIMRLGYTLT
jgi:hypothetical protein